MLTDESVVQGHICLHTPYEGLILLQTKAYLLFNQIILLHYVIFILLCNDLLYFC